MAALTAGVVRLAAGPPVPYVEDGAGPTAPAPTPSQSAPGTTATATTTPSPHAGSDTASEGHSSAGDAVGGAAGGSDASSSAGGATCLSADGETSTGDGTVQTYVPVLDAIQMVSATDGVAAGDGRIWHTSDSGATWQTTYAGPRQIVAVQLVDATRGVALSRNGTLLATSDGGTCWTSLGRPNPHVVSIHLTDPGHGWAVALPANVQATGPDQPSMTGGVLLRTDDGGAHWKQVSAPGDAQTVCQTTRGPVWLTAGGALYRSTDGAGTWDEVVAPGSDTRGAAVQCAGTDVWLLRYGGVATGHAAHRLDHVAADGTLTPILAEQFTNQGEVPHTDSPGTYPGPLSSLSADAAVFVGWTPAMDPGRAVRFVVARSDGTVSDPVTVPFLFEPTAAAFRSPDDGWITGRDGQDRWLILVTHDGGATWQRQLDLPGRNGGS